MKPYMPSSVAHIRTFFASKSELCRRKDLFLQERKHSGAGLPFGGFSSVAGRGNLTKEAPAKVTTLSFNIDARNLLVSVCNLAVVHPCFAYVDKIQNTFEEYPFGVNVG